MTPDQRKHFYFPIWAQTSARLDWRMSGGRLVADLDEQLAGAAVWPDHARSLVTKIIMDAYGAAQRDQRAANADDLRHGCNRVASGGKTESSTKFSQRDLNQFDRLCAVLRDPWDLAASIAWLNSAEDDRKRTLAYLRKLTYEAKLIAIARNAWKTTDVDSLTQSQLDWLVGQVKGSGQRRYATAGQPF